MPSRVLSNAHWLSDVLAGGLVGVLVTLALRALFAAHGATPASMIAGTAAWRRAPPGWLGRLGAGATSCLPAGRPLPLSPANTEEPRHGRH